MHYFVPSTSTSTQRFFPELESSKKQAEADKKAIDDLVRERDILNKVHQYIHILYLS